VRRLIVVVSAAAAVLGALGAIAAAKSFGRDLGRLVG